MEFHEKLATESGQWPQLPYDFSDTTIEWPGYYGRDCFLVLDARAIEKTALDGLLSLPLANPYASSGQYLAELENWHSLSNLAWQLPLSVSQTSYFAFREWDVLTELCHGTIRNPSHLLPGPSFERILDVISSASSNHSCVFELARYSSSFMRFAERAQLILKKLDQQLSEARHLIHRAVPRFCALSWSRKLWYLLHGSHPPKPGCCPAFGCA